MENDEKATKKRGRSPKETKNEPDSNLPFINIRKQIGLPAAKPFRNFTCCFGIGAIEQTHGPVSLFLTCHPVFERRNRTALITELDTEKS